MSDQDIPLEAQCTEDLDCVILSSVAYRPQIVRVAAEEAGLKWKHYLIDHSVALDNYKPWYMKLNPNAYVPTMLVQGNVPVCESIDIIEYMDEHLNGKNKLMEGQPDLIKERYAKFRALH